MDVTPLPDAGKLKFVHVSVDTFSGVIFTSLHSGEQAKDATAHCLSAFAYMGKPEVIKTDNGPAYISKKKIYPFVHSMQFPIKQASHLTQWFKQLWKEPIRPSSNIFKK